MRFRSDNFLSIHDGCLQGFLLNLYKHRHEPFFYVKVLGFGLRCFLKIQKCLIPSNKMDLFVGSLPLNIDETKLKNLFEIYATISSIKIIKDKEAGHSRSFGFVSIPSEEEALIAMNKINGQLVENTRICVKKAYNKKELLYRKNGKKRLLKKHKLFKKLSTLFFINEFDNYSYLHRPQIRQWVAESGLLASQLGHVHEKATILIFSAKEGVEIKKLPIMNKAKSKNFFT